MLNKIIDGRTDLVFEFLHQGNSVDTIDADGISLIQWCAYYGDVSAIRLLISKGARLETLGDNLDLTGAAFHGHWQLTQFLIEQGADASMPSTDNGETALHAACTAASRPAYQYIVEILLANGADPNWPTIPGMETGMFMRDATTHGETPLHRAAAFGGPELVTVLLNAGAKVESRDVHGETPLAWASWHQRPASVLKLLCYGDHHISDSHVSLYTRDHGMGWGGLEKSLRGKPHL